VLTFICLGAAADEAKPAKSALPADLALVPEDAALFLRLEVGSHWNGRESATLKKITKAHPVVVTNWAQDLDKQVGLKMEDIERAVIVVPDFKTPDGFAVILTARKPLDRDKVLGALVPEAQEKKVASKTYYVSDKSHLGAQIVNERVLLVGTAKGVKAFLSRPAAKDGSLRSAIDAAAGKHFLVVGVNPAAFRAAVTKGGDDAKPFLPLFEAKSWRITMDAAKELRINLRLDFADEDAAKAGQKALTAIVPPLTRYFEMVEKEFPAFAKREEGKYPNVSDAVTRLVDLSKFGRAALKDFAPERKGSTVEGSLRIKTAEPATTFILLLSLMPRAAKD
jgi:hypothetical protein